MWLLGGTPDKDPMYDELGNRRGVTDPHDG